MKYRIVESPNGTCRLQVKTSLLFGWCLVKRKVGENQWVAWTGSYAEAYEECQKFEREMRSKPIYHYPPLTPPLPEAPERTDLPKYDPPYHPGTGSILLNERL